MYFASYYARTTCINSVAIVSEILPSYIQILQTTITEEPTDEMIRNKTQKVQSKKKYRAPAPPARYIIITTVINCKQCNCVCARACACMCVPVCVRVRACARACVCMKMYDTLLVWSAINVSVCSLVQFFNCFPCPSFTPYPDINIITLKPV